mmetsp:Transcript_66008/g.123086  ORF Transcript_66008/g.123086 Transcript_66008/m.123086 type:complete len:97 (+) Transcript_66008:111-401(+)
MTFMQNMHRKDHGEQRRHSRLSHKHSASTVEWFGPWLVYDVHTICHEVMGSACSHHGATLCSHCGHLIAVRAALLPLMEAEVACVPLRSGLPLVAL